jgi:hypothetical protein
MLYIPGLKLMLKMLPPGVKVDEDKYRHWKRRAAIKPSLLMRKSDDGMYPDAKISFYGVVGFIHDESRSIWGDTPLNCKLLPVVMAFHKRVVCRLTGNHGIEFRLIATYEYEEEADADITD